MTRKRDSTFTELVAKRDKKRSKKVKAVGGLASDDLTTNHSSAVDFEDVTSGNGYVPRSKNTRETYNLLTSFITRPSLLGSSLPRDVILDSVNEVVSTCRSGGTIGDAKALLGNGLGQLEWTKIKDWCEKLSDWRGDDEKSNKDENDNEQR